MEQTRNGDKPAAALSYTAIVRFFLPIALGVFVVSFIYPIFSWGISRFAGAKDALAAFSVARSLYFIMASPILVLRQTIVALVHDAASYRSIRKFSWTVIVLVFLLFLLIGLTPVGHFVFAIVMGVEGLLLTMSRTVFVVFSLVVVLSGHSLFLQGLAILGKRSRHIFYAMLIQIVCVALLMRVATMLPFQDGAIAATVSYILGILASNIYLELLVHRKVAAELAGRQVVQAEEKPPAMRETLRFYLPLVVATFILCLSIPLINATLAKTGRASVYLSAFDVAWGLGWLILGTIEVSHQVPLFFMKHYHDAGRKVFTFTIFFGLICTAIVALVGFTPLGNLLVGRLLGIEADVSPYVLLTMQALTALPLLMVVRQYLWGLLMHQKETKPVTWGKAINIAGLFAVLRLTPYFTSLSPVAFVLLAMALAEVLEQVYLLWHYFARRRKMVLEKKAA